MSTHLDVKCRLSIVFFVGIQVPTLFRSVSFSRSSNLPKLSRRACDNSCAVWSPGGAHNDFLFMGFLGIENLMCRYLFNSCKCTYNHTYNLHLVCTLFASFNHVCSVPFNIERKWCVSYHAPQASTWAMVPKSKIARRSFQPFGITDEVNMRSMNFSWGLVVYDFGANFKMIP